ncbi:nucleotide-sugar transporter [Cryptosporidium ubiquitum]|uniref:Nucleotide-sugar transporter n=1 Tax=Cryptosporidium ubiquitum TaxID=857276 RepID=A0A1J4MDX6_9CRYT|nr:nucleotide-sugar transporter [Cryptosporidium ubiquitum]OII72442.1 nucleotide-sugar transporter [Cryptosporidium ubiquitum]
MRISRIRKSENDELYFNSCAVVTSEVLKLFCSLIIILYTNNFNINEFYNTLRFDVFNSLKSIILVGVPGLLYVVQNNLLFIALSNLSGAVYHVTYQLKILATAVISVIILNKQLSKIRWLSLLLLTIGAVLVQTGKSSQSTTSNSPGSEFENTDNFLGISSVLLACFTSGLAGVFLEKLLKDSKTSIWGRNMQLALYGTIFGFIGCLTGKEGLEISQKGFFYGFNSLVWLVICLQAIGGIIVAAVLKYADNILKCFGNSLSIIMSCILSWYLGDYSITLNFFIGSVLVIWSIFIYGLERAFPCSDYLLKLRLVLKRNSRNKIITKYKNLRESSSEASFDFSGYNSEVGNNYPSNINTQNNNNSNNMSNNKFKNFNKFIHPQKQNRDNNSDIDDVIPKGLQMAIISSGV